MKKKLLKVRKRMLDEKLVQAYSESGGTNENCHGC